MKHYHQGVNPARVLSTHLRKIAAYSEQDLGQTAPGHKG